MRTAIPIRNSSRRRLGRTLFGLLALLLSSGLGCQRSRPAFQTVLPVAATRVNNIQQTLDKKLADGEMIQFDSGNGIWEGTDNDLALELHADGSAKVTAYGNDIFVYEGEYSIKAGDDGSDLLVLSLRNSQSNESREWPAMEVYTFGPELLLIPATGRPRGISQRGGRPVAEDSYAVWPLREARPQPAEPLDSPPQD